MDEQKNMISEAARLVDVESHVLRYWEEELHIPINRTEMGHRYYTKEDIQLFRCIKKLKDEGVSIKELKSIVPELLDAKQKQLHKAELIHSEENSSQADPASGKNKTGEKEPAIQKEITAKQETSSQKKGTKKEASSKANKKENASKKEESFKEKHTESLPAKADKQNSEVVTDVQLQQVRDLIGNVLTDVVTSNNEVLTKNISQTVTSDVMQEMNFLVQAKERRDEEHFRKLDVLIRQQQNLRRDAAKVGPLGRLKRILT